MNARPDHATPTLLKWALAAVALMTACSSHRSTVEEPFRGPRHLSDYKILEMPDLESVVKGEFDAEVLREIPERTMIELREARIFREVTRGTDRTENVLVLEGVVVSYERGKRWKRAVLPTRAGKAYCTLKVTFRDKASGDVVSRMTFEGELAGGFLGGPATDSAKGVVAAIVDFFQRNY